MKIKYGSVEYFTLLELQDKLKMWSYDRLDLIYLDKLRNEVEMKIKAITFEYTENLKKTHVS